MAFLDPINTILTKEIVPGVADGVFRNSPLLAHFKRDSLRKAPTWPIQENLGYDVLRATAYAPGDTFDLGQRQLFTGGTVTPRYYEVPVTAFLEKLRIEMAGPTAVFDYADYLLQNAALSLSGLLANDLFRHGQSVSGSDRSLRINGLDEALNDGSNNGFDGRAYSSYLTLNRSDLNGSYNSLMTGPTANINGALSYPILEQAFNSVVVGTEKPNLILTTNLGMSYIKMASQAQQRFESTDLDLGFIGVKFNGVPVIQDQYAPGTRTASAVDTALGYSAVAGGETIWFLNTKYMRLYLTTDPLYAFGFTGFMPAQATSLVAGHYRACLNFTVQQPRYSRYLFGITG